MRKKFDCKILLIILLIVVLIFGWILLIRNGNATDNYSKNTKNISDTQSNASASTQTINTTSQIESAISENIELHATYYFKECYVVENQEVKAGENILKYTNGKYLTAPYNCVINKISIPNTSGQCTNDHYITISSTNLLSVNLSIDETDISNLSIGQEAKITITALDDIEITGNITKISNTASNGKFTATVQFENNGNIKLGMTANVVI